MPSASTVWFSMAWHAAKPVVVAAHERTFRWVGAWEFGLVDADAPVAPASAGMTNATALREMMDKRCTGHPFRWEAEPIRPGDCIIGGKPAGWEAFDQDIARQQPATEGRDERGPDRCLSIPLRSLSLGAVR